MTEETRAYGSCLVTIKDNYAIMTFNRPDKLNAFSPDLFEGIQKALPPLKETKRFGPSFSSVPVIISRPEAMWRWTSTR